MVRAAWTSKAACRTVGMLERHVRNLINRGECQFFRQGGKLIRLARLPS